MAKKEELKDAGSDLDTQNVQAKKKPVYLDVFNVKSQAVEAHELTIKNGEYILTAKDGSFIKYPAELSKDELLAEIEKYNANEDNLNQVQHDTEEEEAENQARLDEFREE